MGQKDGGEFGEVFRLMAFEPENFGGGETGPDGVAQFGDGGVGAAEFAREGFAFGGGGGVAPEFGGADDLAFLVTRGTNPCCWPLTPMATTSAGLAWVALRAAWMALAVAWAQVRGCCSLGPGGAGRG